MTGGFVHTPVCIIIDAMRTSLSSVFPDKGQFLLELAKDRLDSMHDETGSLFKIKKIDPATTIKAVPFK